MIPGTLARLAATCWPATSTASVPNSPANVTSSSSGSARMKNCARGLRRIESRS